MFSRLTTRFASLLVAVVSMIANAAAADHPALNKPDQFGWELFATINKPADAADPDGPVVWEGWALASDVFRDPHRAPAWPDSAPRERSIQSLEPLPLQDVSLELQRRGLTIQSLRSTRGVSPLRIDPRVLQRHGNETRMNRATFDFIVQHDMYFIEGQEDFFNKNRKVDFPVESQEIKAQWRRLDDPAQHSRYHTAKVNNAGRTEVWGLTALHITTKDLPNWFWATWEHVDNDGLDAVVPSRDAFGVDPQGGPSAELLTLFQQHGLGQKWRNYILRGTQVDFVDSIGRPTILANSQVEGGFQETSSCITCHARSSIGPKPRQSFSTTEPQPADDDSRLAVFESAEPTRGSIGRPDPTWFVDTSTSPAVRKFTQLDFVWSLFRARRRHPFPQPTTVVSPIPQGGRAAAATAAEAAPCCGANAFLAADESAAPGDATSLDSLERAASARGTTSTPELAPEERAKLVAAAANFAASVAGDDDAAFTRAATAALGQAILARQGATRAFADEVPPNIRLMAALDEAEGEAADTESADGQLIWRTPELNTNFRQLMTEAADEDSGLVPISGPPPMARIVGPGTQLVSANQFRDCVCVGQRIGTTDRYCCTGTLIAANVVVTAGHCFDCLGSGTNNAVVFVGTQTSGPGTTHTGRAFRHPNYNQGGLSNDLTVIVLDAPVAGVTPRRIASSQEIDRASFFRAVGFGNSDFASTTGFGTKRMVDVPVASISCSGPNDPANFGCDPQLEMVAGFVGLGPDSCNGDSGGPVYVLVGSDARDDTAWALAGATSRATGLATRPCGDGGIYARIDKYLDFIEDQPGVVLPGRDNSRRRSR